MINFPIHRFTPRLIDLRLYVYQMANDTFGLSESLCEQLEDTFGSSSLETIDALGIDDIRELLDEYVPVYLFVWSSAPDVQHEQLQQLPENQLLSELVEIDQLPILYTGIEQVSFDRDGLIVLSSYMSQIYTLFRADGTELLGPCHDLDLGMQGRVLSRSSSDIIWELYIFDGIQLNLLKQTGPLSWEDRFPHLSNRDRIPQMFEDQNSYKEFYPDLHPENAAHAAALLSENPYAWLVLKDQYKDDAWLAFEAVKANVLAFTFLSARLREDETFIQSLLPVIDQPSLLLFYLSPELQSMAEKMITDLGLDPENEFDDFSGPAGPNEDDDLPF
jgi:hypothetical protein